MTDSTAAVPPATRPPAIPAATLIVFRDGDTGPPEVLMVERAKAMAFAPGALVFPGGRVDPGDHALAEQVHASAPGPDRDTADTAGRIAAIRETIEEAGLPIGLSPPPTAAAFDRLRAALHAGVPFHAALRDAGTWIDPAPLSYFARWRPDHAATRIFDTRFYLAPLPIGAPCAQVDATENVRLFWSTAADVLADADAGRATIIFPTRRNLERLALFAKYADAVAHTRAFPVRQVTPWIESRDGVDHLCIPDDLGYPVTAEPVRDAIRG